MHTEPQGTDVWCGDQGTPDVQPQQVIAPRHTPLLTQPTDVMFKDTALTRTSETRSSPECHRVHSDRMQKILAGCNNVVMYAAHRFNGCKDGQRTQLDSKAGRDPAKR